MAEEEKVDRRRGAARPHAARGRGFGSGKGMPKGHVTGPVRDRMAAREHLVQRIIADLDPLLDAQLANAKGLKYLVKRDSRSGKFERIGPEGVDGEGVIEVWEKDPNVTAFVDLMDRGLGKVVQEVDLNVSAQTAAKTDAELLAEAKALIAAGDDGA